MRFETFKELRDYLNTLPEDTKLMDSVSVINNVGHFYNDGPYKGKCRSGHFGDSSEDRRYNCCKPKQSGIMNVNEIPEKCISIK